ncbi:MAG: hypothetical protein CM1200mP10_20720 [Candidatus Neomarinimicrobiota bacterium]|nr:MAG: hypothetical protein CM1200mP10_20720 [Candidatus Neomarinimicrobiota bacterium]
MPLSGSEALFRHLTCGLTEDPNKNNSMIPEQGKGFIFSLKICYFPVFMGTSIIL